MTPEKQQELNHHLDAIAPAIATRLKQMKRDRMLYILL